MRLDPDGYVIMVYPSAFSQSYIPEKTHTWFWKDVDAEPPNFRTLPFWTVVDARGYLTRRTGTFCSEKEALSVFDEAVRSQDCKMTNDRLISVMTYREAYALEDL